MSVLDARSGRLLHSVAVGPGLHALAVHEHAGHVFVTNATDDSVSLLDARSGRLLRTIPVGLTPSTLAVDEGTDRVLLTGALWGHPDPTAVSLLDARSGTLLRMIAVRMSAGAITVDARRGQAFVSNSQATTVLALDGRSASVVRTMAVGLPGSLTVHAHADGVVGLVADEHVGAIFVANADDASVRMVDPANRRIVRTVPLGLPACAIAVDQHRDRIVVLTCHPLWAATADQVAVLDGRTGRLLHTVAVGADASALAVDERTGEAFVSALNVYGIPAGSDSTDLLRTWLRRWLPSRWVARLPLPAPATTTGTVTMLDLSRL